MTGDDNWTFVNIFTPKPGMVDAFIDHQLAYIEASKAASTAHGWLSNELFRARDGDKLIVLTRFRSREGQAAWSESESFKTHLEDIKPFLESVISTPVASIARFGDPTLPRPISPSEVG